jgi:hypothetical protein
MFPSAVEAPVRIVKRASARDPTAWWRGMVRCVGRGKLQEGGKISKEGKFVPTSDFKCSS